MKFKTSITNTKADGTEILRGYSLADLVAQKSFSDVIFLALRGELPTPAESTMFNTLLVMAIDHGPGTASAQTARVAASAKASVQAAVASGVLGMGDRHGGAVGNAAAFFIEHKNENDIKGLLARLKEQKIRIPGFGHAILTKDHRSEVLFATARATHTFGAHSEFALAVGEALNSRSSKPLPLNVDGAKAAILMDLGFTPETATGIFIIARVPGLVAHVVEEMINDEGIRRLGSEDIEYTGSAPRALP